MAKKKVELSEEIVVVGVARHPLRDSYHWLLKANVVHVLGLVVTLFLAVNALYALAYWWAGGIANATGGLLECFFFSVQTMGTIGYGSMYPTSLVANLLVTSEAVVGLLVTALATGLVFTRFSQPRAEVTFASRLCIAPMDGVPTVICRMGNDRNDPIVDADLHLDIVRTVRTKEGVLLYRSTPLKLVRDHAQSLTRTWTVLHVIDSTSPLHGVTPEDAVKMELEATLSVSGMDEVTHQPVHARARYRTNEIVFGARPVDLLRELPDGRIELDVRRFDDLEPTPKTESFPFSFAA